MTKQKTQTIQTVKQAAVDTTFQKSPVAAAGVGSIAMVLAAYLGPKLNLDPDMTALMVVALGVLTTMGVRYLHANFPVLLNALETATGRDLDGDGDVGK